MKCIMRVWSPEEIEGQYLVSFDFDAMRGAGYGIFTDKLERAMHFKTLRDAMEFWRTQSTVKPLRPDGMPNRPLTASTIEIIPLAEEHDNGTASKDDAARRHHGSSHHQG